MKLRDTPPFLLMDVESAVQMAQDYGLLYYLAQIVEYGDIKDWQNLFNNQDARKIISQDLCKIPWRYSGAPGTEKQKNDIRDMYVLQLLYYLIGYGYKITGKTHSYFKNNFVPESSCDVASRAVEKWGFNSIGPEQIYKYIWRQHKKIPSYRWYIQNDNLPHFEQFKNKGQADLEKDIKKGSRSEPMIATFKLKNEIPPKKAWPPLLFKNIFEDEDTE